MLHKNPANVHFRELAFGKAYVFFPEADENKTTAALLLDVDPVELVRGASRGGEGLLSQYVNDRPYAASSLLSVAMSRVFGQTLSGRSKERQELADTEIPLEIRLAALPCRGGEELVRRLFEPLGYEVEVEGRLLDRDFPEWGPSRCFAVALKARARFGVAALQPLRGRDPWPSKPPVCCREGRSGGSLGMGRSLDGEYGPFSRTGI